MTPGEAAMSTVVEPWIAGPVIVTGASGEIGRAIAGAFAERGARVALAGATSERVQAAVATLSGHGERIRGMTLDLRSAGAAASLIEQVAAEWGAPGVLVNCAGINFNRAIAEIDEAAYDAVMDINVKSAFFTSRAVAECMVQARIPGRIVNITSGNYRYARPNAALYAASKAALELLTRSFAVEYGAAGITANAVAPGLVERGGAVTADYQRVADFYRANSPAGRLVSPADVARAVLFLASADAATITGETIVVDAGFSAGRNDFPRRTQQR